MSHSDVVKNRRCVSARQNRRGTIVVLAAFLMVVLVAVVAFGVDMGYIAVART
jgi:Flp pilus assembly protein TadG